MGRRQRGLVSRQRAVKGVPRVTAPAFDLVDARHHEGGVASLCGRDGHCGGGKRGGEGERAAEEGAAISRRLDRAAHRAGSAARRRRSATSEPVAFSM